MGTKANVSTLKEAKLGLYNAQGRLARMSFMLTTGDIKQNSTVVHTDLVALQDCILGGINYLEHLQGTFKEIVDILRHGVNDVI